jgi:putative hydroxymethylpyrimidine transport system substrate-binding protein
VKTYKIALEWFINPDHLPLILAKDVLSKQGINLEIIEPDEHYDGFEAIKKGEIDFTTNEPLHMIEQFDEAFFSMGTFFETEGGVLLTPQADDKLRMNQEIKISTPVANEKTNTLGFEIIKRYYTKAEIDIKPSQVEFIETDFYHIKHIIDGYDGAWLYFYNFEGIEAKYEGLELLMLNSKNSNFPNFAALDIFANRSGYENDKDGYNHIINTIKKSIMYLKLHPDHAKDIYYWYTKSEKSVLMDDIIEDTITRFDDTFSSDYKKHEEVLYFFNNLGISSLDIDTFKKGFLK